jgi:hypothetical protein
MDNSEMKRRLVAIVATVQGLQRNTLREDHKARALGAILKDAKEVLEVLEAFEASEDREIVNPLDALAAES